MKIVDSTRKNTLRVLLTPLVVSASDRSVAVVLPGVILCGKLVFTTRHFK